MTKNEEFNEKIRKHSSDIQKFIYTLARDNFAKDDILQNTIIRAFKCFDDLEKPESFYSWILQIAKSETARYFVAEKKWRTACEYEVGASYDEYDSRSDFDRIENEEIADEVRVIMETLRPDYSQIILLHVEYQMSLKEISETLGRKYSTVKSQYQRGVEIAKERYEKCANRKGIPFWMLTE